MLLEDARALMAETPRDRSLGQRLFRGLQILAQYDKTLQFSFGHEQMWCADFETTVKQMGQEEIREMARLGWFEDEEAWSLRS